MCITELLEPVSEITFFARSLIEISKSLPILTTLPIVLSAKAILTTASPYVYAYSFSEVTGFGTKYNDPSTLLATGSFTGGINFN